MEKIILRLRKYYAVVIISTLLIIIFINHLPFIRYVFSWEMLMNIWQKELVFNVIITPIIFLLFILTFWVSGKAFLSIIGGKDFDNFYNAPLSTAIGMGLFNCILMVLGFIGILYASLIVTYLLFGSIFAITALFRIRHKQFLPSHFFKNPWHSILLFIIFAALIFGLISALSPPHSWDALACHLPIPKFYALAHKIYRIRFFEFFQCTISMEMLTCAGLLLNNDLLGQLFPFLSEILLLISVFLFAKRYLTQYTGLVTAVLLSILPVSLYLSGTVNSDFSVALFSFLTIISLWEFINTRNVRWIYVGGVCAGLTAGAKMNGLIICLWACAVLIFLLLKRRLKVVHIVVFGLLFILVSFPLYVRNYYVSGNPVYPMFYEHLGGIETHPSVLYYRKMDRESTMGVKRTFLNFLLLPYHLIIMPDRFQNKPHYFMISLLLAIICIFPTTRKYISPLEKFLLSCIITFTAAWFVIDSHSWRRLFPIIPLVCFIMLNRWEVLHNKWLKTIIGLFLLINIAPFLAHNVSNELFAVGAVPSRQSPKTSPRIRYLQKKLNYYSVFQYINKHAPLNSKILLFREIRGYYLNRDFILGDPLKNVIVYDKINTVGELKERLLSLGITHIVINYLKYPESKYYYTPHVLNLMYKFTSTYCSTIFQSNGVVLYKVEC